jgi:hypothetical protein
LEQSLWWWHIYWVVEKGISDKNVEEITLEGATPGSGGVTAGARR